MTENTILLTYHQETTKTGGQKSIAVYQVEKLRTHSVDERTAAELEHSV